MALCLKLLVAAFIVFATDNTVLSRPSGRESIEAMGKEYGFPAPTKSGKHILLESKYTSMSFEANSRKLYFNGMLIWLNGTIAIDDGVWSIKREDAATTINPLLRSGDILSNVGFSNVVLDPGHGGDDTGAIGSRKVYEKKVVLDIAKRVRTKLQESGITVKLTRETDSNLPLAERSAKARELKADLFISIHCNAAHDTRAEGIETYVLPAAGFTSTSGNMSKQVCAGNRHDKANMILAYCVQKELLEQTEGADRGIRRARFDVLRDAPCPAILVECGFVSNRNEEEKMLTRKYRDQAAEGIAAGIREYIKKAREATGR